MFTVWMDNVYFKSVVVCLSVYSNASSLRSVSVYGSGITERHPGEFIRYTMCSSSRLLIVSSRLLLVVWDMFRGYRSVDELTKLI